MKSDNSTNFPEKVTKIGYLSHLYGKKVLKNAQMNYYLWILTF